MDLTIVCGTLLVPTMLKRFHEQGREHGIELLKEYFKYYQDNKPEEALKVFGIDFSKESIEEIQNNYREDTDKLKERLKTYVKTPTPSERLRKRILEPR